MRIAIDAPPVRSLSANEKMVYRFLKDGLTPIEIARRMKIPIGRDDFSANLYDVPAETVTRLITSIREKGWDIPTDMKKEENQVLRLTEETKREIVQIAMTGTMTRKAIAEKFGIGRSTVGYLVDLFRKSGEAALSGETEVETKEEPATAATETGSESEICDNISNDIIPENPENVKPLIPILQSVIEACWGRKAELEEQIAQEQAVIDDWKRQIAEIDDFLELAEIANPIGGAV